MKNSFNLPTPKAFSSVILPLPSHIIIDANGTIAAIDDCLIGSDAYYYVERNLKEFLNQFWYDKNILTAINKLKLEYINDKMMHSSRCPKILVNLDDATTASSEIPSPATPNTANPAVNSTSNTQQPNAKQNFNPQGGGEKNAGPSSHQTQQHSDSSGTAGKFIGTLPKKAVGSELFLENRSGSIKTASATSAISSSGLISSHPSASSQAQIKPPVPEDELVSVYGHILWRLRERKISPGTRMLLEHVLFQAYDRGSLKMLIYEEVPDILNDWRMVKGIKLVSFSRGSGESQRCYFRSTTRGNISKLFSHFVDGTDKMSPSTELFKKVLERIKPDRTDSVLYITSVIKDAETATKCQINAVLVDRDDHYSDSPLAIASREKTANSKHNSTGSRSQERLRSSRGKIKEKDRIRVVKSLTDIIFKRIR